MTALSYPATILLVTSIASCGSWLAANLLAITNSLLQAMIRTSNLTKVYRADVVETRALDDVDLTINAGEFVSVMGPSGCGKSTLLNIVGLLDKPTSGAYQFDGQEVGSFSERQRSRLRKGKISFVFQSFNLINDLTVQENVELPLQYLGVPAKTRKARVKQVLSRARIDHRSSHFPQQLSGGQQQRVAIARAVVAKPRLVLADEPTGNLDSKNGAEIMNLLAELNQAGTTIVMVTHSRPDAEYSHRTIHLFDGHVAKEDLTAKYV